MGKTKNILLLLCISFVIAGCSSGLNPLELQEKIINANSKIMSYKYVSTMEMELPLPTPDQKTMPKVKIKTEGDVDKKNKKMYMKSTVITEGELIPQKNKATPATIEAYMLDQMYYLQLFGTGWVKISLISLKDNEQAKMNDFFAQSDEVSRIASLAGMSKLESFKEITMRGKKYYEVILTIDKRKIAEYFLRAEATPDKLYQEDPEAERQLQEMIAKYTVTLYVNTQTYIIEKSILDMTMRYPDATLQFGQESRTTTARVETEIKNVNQPVSIILPPEAAAARDIAEDAAIFEKLAKS